MKFADRELLAAGIVRDILFRNADAADLYLKWLDCRFANFDVLDRYDREDGSVIMRIVQQYNGCDLIQL